MTTMETYENILIVLCIHSHKFSCIKSMPIDCSVGQEKLITCFACLNSMFPASAVIIQVNQKFFEFIKRRNIGIANMHKKYRRQDRDPG